MRAASLRRTAALVALLALAGCMGSAPPPGDPQRQQKLLSTYGATLQGAIQTQVMAHVAAKALCSAVAPAKPVLDHDTCTHIDHAGALLTSSIKTAGKSYDDAIHDRPADLQGAFADLGLAIVQFTAEEGLWTRR